MRLFFIRQTVLWNDLNVAHCLPVTCGCARAAATSLCLELLHAFQKNVANDRESFGADFVERVLRRMPVVDVAAGAVIEINHIHRGNVAFQKGLVIVFDSGGIFDEDVSVAELFGNAPDEIDKRFGGIRFALEVRRARSDDIRQ